MAVACVFVPECLMAGRRRACKAVAETVTIVLEHFIGNELKHATFTFFTDVTYFSCGSCTQRRALFGCVESAGSAKFSLIQTFIDLLSVDETYTFLQHGVRFLIR